MATIDASISLVGISSFSAFSNYFPSAPSAPRIPRAILPSASVAKPLPRSLQVQAIAASRLARSESDPDGDWALPFPIVGYPAEGQAPYRLARTEGDPGDWGLGAPIEGQPADIGKSTESNGSPRPAEGQVWPRGA